MQVALGRGYYQQNGLKTVSIIGYGMQGADQIALLLGGHAHFLHSNSSLLLHEKSSGSGLVALMNVCTGGSIAVVVAKDEAQKLHIPSANSTEADVEAQLAALKGSGMEIGVPSETGDNYSDLIGGREDGGPEGRQRR